MKIPVYKIVKKPLKTYELQISFPFLHYFCIIRIGELVMLKFSQTSS